MKNWKEFHLKEKVPKEFSAVSVLKPYDCNELGYRNTHWTWLSHKWSANSTIRRRVKSRKVIEVTSFKFHTQKNSFLKKKERLDGCRGCSQCSNELIGGISLQSFCGPYAVITIDETWINPSSRKANRLKKEHFHGSNTIRVVTTVSPWICPYYYFSFCISKPE